MKYIFYGIIIKNKNMKTKSLQNNYLNKRMKYYNNLEKKTLKKIKGKKQLLFVSIAQNLIFTGQKSFTVSQIQKIYILLQKYRQK